MAGPTTPNDGNEVVERFRAPSFIRKELTEFLVEQERKVVEAVASSSSPSEA